VDVPAADTSNYLNIGNVIQGDMVAGPITFNVSTNIPAAANNAYLYGGDTAIYSTFSGFNWFIGKGAGNFTTTGIENIAIGPYALLGVTSGNSNIVLGYNAGCGITTTSENIAIGVSCLNQVNGSNNTAVGYRIADFLTTGDSNTIIGADTCRTLTTGSSNICIGSIVDAPAADTSNYLNIGNVFKGDMLGSLEITRPLYYLTIQAEADFLSAELCPDSDLATDPVASGWTLAAGVDVWSAGQIVSTGAAGSSAVTIPFNATAGKYYQITVTRTSTGAGYTVFNISGSYWLVDQ
jgi:hypothetical protein